MFGELAGGFIFERQRDIGEHRDFRRRAAINNAAEAPVGLRMAATMTLVSSTNLTCHTISYYIRYRRHAQKRR